MAQTPPAAILGNVSITLPSRKITVGSSAGKEDYEKLFPSLSDPKNWRVDYNGRRVAIERIVATPQRTIEIIYQRGEIKAGSKERIPKGALHVRYLPEGKDLEVPTGPSGAAGAGAPGAAAAPPPSPSFNGCLAFGLTRACSHYENITAVKCS